MFGLSSLFGGTSLEEDDATSEYGSGTDAITEDGGSISSRSRDESSSSSQACPVGSSSNGTVDQREAASRLLKAAEAKHAAADDALAAKLVAQSLASGCVLPGALALQAHLAKFGPGSKAHAAVARALSGTPRTVLGVAEPISPTRLKKAYKRMCLELHPDRCHARNAEAAFKRVQEAYAALDPTGGARSSTARMAAKRMERRKAESQQRERDRAWTSRGVDPRYGATASRGRRATHLEPAKKRVNGKTSYTPKAGPPPPPQPKHTMGPLEA